FQRPSTTDLYTLSLHDALPILSTDGASVRRPTSAGRSATASRPARRATALLTAEPTPTWASSTAARTAAVSGATVIASPRPKTIDRKSTRLNSSHQIISYAVFC